MSGTLTASPAPSEHSQGDAPLLLAGGMFWLWRLLAVMAGGMLPASLALEKTGIGIVLYRSIPVGRARRLRWLDPPRDACRPPYAEHEDARHGEVPDGVEDACLGLPGVG
jgi:hypothetical protein